MSMAQTGHNETKLIIFERCKEQKITVGQND